MLGDRWLHQHRLMNQLVKRHFPAKLLASSSFGIDHPSTQSSEVERAKAQTRRPGPEARFSLKKGKKLGVKQNLGGLNQAYFWAQTQAQRLKTGILFLKIRLTAHFEKLGAR